VCHRPVRDDILVRRNLQALHRIINFYWLIGLSRELSQFYPKNIIMKHSILAGQLFYREQEFQCCRSTNGASKVVWGGEP
jgi:hypothetical protein